MVVYSVLSTLAFKTRWELQLFLLKSVLILTMHMIKIYDPLSHLVELQVVLSKVNDCYCIKEDIPSLD